MIQFEMTEENRANYEAVFKLIYRVEPTEEYLERFVLTLNTDLRNDERLALAKEYGLAKGPSPRKKSSLQLAIRDLRHPTRVINILGSLDSLRG